MKKSKPPKSPKKPAPRKARSAESKLTARSAAGARARKSALRDNQELLLHDLQTHQTELEAQNENLRIAHQELETSRSRFADLYELSPVGFFTFDAKGIVLAVNLTGARQLGIVRSLLLRRSFAHYVAPPYRDIFRSHCTGTVRRGGGGERSVCELEILRRDRTSFFGRLESVPLIPEQRGSRKILSVLIDITDQRLAENALARITARFEAMFDSMPDAVVMTDSNRRIVLINPAGQTLFGYSLGEVLGHSASILYADRTDYIRLGKTHYATHIAAAPPVEVRYRRKSGAVFDAETVASPVRDAGGEVLGFLGIHRDITVKKQIEERLAHLASFPQLNPNPVLETTLDGAVTFLNPSAQALLADQGLNGAESLVPGNLDALIRTWNKKEHATSHREIKIQNRVFDATIHLLPNLRTARLYLLDITERKRADEALRTSEAKYRSLFDNMIDGFALHEIVLDPSGRPVDYIFLEMNNAFEKMVGLNAADIVGRRVTEVLPGIENDPADWIGTYGKVALTGEEIRFMQFSEQLGRWYSVIAYSPSRGRFAAIFEDITERKRAEETLEKQMRLVDLANDAIIIRDWATDRITYWNAGAALLYGWTKEEATGSVTHDLLKTRFPAALEQIRSGLVARGTWKGELYHTRKDGKVICVLSHWALQKNGPQPESYIEINTDITDRKRATNIAEARLYLIQLADKYPLDKLLTATIDEAEVLTGSRSGFLHFLEADQRTLALQAWSTRTTEELCTADGKGRHYDVSEAGVWADCVRERRPVIQNDYASLPHRKGLPPDHAPIVRELVVPVFRGDRIVAILGVGNKETGYDEGDIEIVTRLADVAWEITERKRAEEALVESERAHRTLARNIPDIVYRLDLRTSDMAFFNDRITEITGYRPDELEHGSICSLETRIVKEDRTRVSDVVTRAIRDRSAFEVEYRFVARNGNVITLLERGSVISDETGNLHFIDGIIRDITARKRAEESLRESENRFRMLTESSPDYIALHDRELRHLYVNPTIARLLGLPQESFVGKTLDEIAIPSEAAAVLKSMLQAALETGREQRGELLLPTKDGPRYFHRKAVPFREGPDGAVQAILVFANDITDRKRSEQALQELNTELERRVEQRTRFYAVLAGINEAIVRKKDQQELFDYVCRIIVETGGLKLAWIGFLDAATRRIRPVASYGATAYLEGLTFTAADDPRGNVPTEVAILTNGHVANMDFETAGIRAPRDERARSFGIRSASAVPLRRNGDVIGALTIYSGQPHFFSEEEITLLTALADDISYAVEALATERNRREMEERLRATYAEIEDLYNNAPCGYHSLDENGVFLRINDTELRWLGYRRDEVVGKKKMTDFYTPEGVALFNETFPRLMRDGAVSDVEVELLRKNGTVMRALLSSTAVMSADSQFLMTRTTLYDITEWKQAQAESRRLAAALEAAADAVVITEPQAGQIVYVNGTFEKLTGYRPEEVIGRTLHVLDSGKHDAEFYRSFREMIERDGVWHGRVASKRRDETIFFEDRTCSPVRNPSGEIVNYVTFIHDVTDRLRLEAVAESVSQLENIGAVFAGVRHEIGNPINNAKLMLSVLQRKLDTLGKERVEEYVQKTLAEIGRVEHLLKTLKTFKLFETPTLENLETPPLLELFRGLVNEYVREHGITLSIRIAPGAERIRADSRALQHVLLNLVTNAADALKDVPDPRIEIGVTQEQDRIRIRVEDNGHGMTPEQAAGLFKPFHTTKHHGTGLGLVIVKKMLAAMNGSITIASRHRGGTTADIFLPAGTSGKDGGGR